MSYFGLGNLATIGVRTPGAIVGATTRQPAVQQPAPSLLSRLDPNLIRRTNEAQQPRMVSGQIMPLAPARGDGTAKLARGGSGWGGSGPLSIHLPPPPPSGDSIPGDLPGGGVDAFKRTCASMSGKLIGTKCVWANDCMEYSAGQFLPCNDRLPPPTPGTLKAAAGGNTMLYAGLGVAALAALFLLRK